MGFQLGKKCKGCGRKDAHTETKTGLCVECHAERDPENFRRIWSASPLDPRQVNGIACRSERLIGRNVPDPSAEEITQH